MISSSLRVISFLLLIIFQLPRFISLLPELKISRNSWSLSVPVGFGRTSLIKMFEDKSPVLYFFVEDFFDLVGFLNALISRLVVSLSPDGSVTVKVIVKFPSSSKRNDGGFTFSKLWSKG